MIDVSNFRNFAEAFVGKSVALDGPHGRVTVTKSELEAIATAAEAAIDAQEYERLLTVQERLEAVEEWVQAQRHAGAPVPPGLIRALGGSAHDPRLVGVVAAALGELGADPSQADALLSVINATVEHLQDEDEGPQQQLLEDDEEYEDDPDEGYEDEEEPAPAPRVVARKVAAPARKRAPRHAAGRRNRTARVAPMLPGGRPVPAEPQEAAPITADRLFGIRRTGNGRFDAGGLDADGL